MQNVVVKEDLEGIQTWSRIEETFVNDRGRDLLDCRVTHFHDGSIQQDDYVGGSLRHRVIGNNSDGSVLIEGNVKPWDQIELRYDDQGSELQVTTFFSDGGVRNEMFHVALFNDQTPSELIEFNTKAPLKTVTVDFDGQGRVCGRHFFHVDGAIVYERYEDGTIREILQELAPGPVTSESHGWSSIVQCFDETSKLTRKITVWDDGSETEEVFEDAVFDLSDESDLQIAMHEVDAVQEEQDVVLDEVLSQPVDEETQVFEETAFDTAMAEWLQSKFGSSKNQVRPANDDQSLTMAVGA